MIPAEKSVKYGLYVWSVFLFFFYMLAIYYLSNKIISFKNEATNRHNARINIQEKIDSDNSQASKVSVGIYLERIAELSTKNTSWTVDFYIWFRWQDSTLNPGSTFQVVDGEILTCDMIDTFTLNNDRYAQYRVVAQITKFFDVKRYPRDNHLLTISIEDKKHSIDILRYIPDTVDSFISSRVIIPGYTIGNPVLKTKTHSYKTNFGITNTASKTNTKYHQAIFSVEISRPDWGLFFKMFQALFASVGIALLVFLMDPAGEGRIGLGIGAFFAAVASSCFSTSELPGIGVLTMNDMINIFGMITILLSVLSSIISMHIVKNPQNTEIARLYDIVSLSMFATGYTVGNIIIARCT